LIARQFTTTKPLSVTHNFAKLDTFSRFKTNIRYTLRLASLNFGVPLHPHLFIPARVSNIHKWYLIMRLIKLLSEDEMLAEKEAVLTFLRNLKPTFMRLKLTASTGFARS